MTSRLQRFVEGRLRNRGPPRPMPAGGMPAGFGHPRGRAARRPGDPGSRSRVPEAEPQSGAAPGGHRSPPSRFRSRARSVRGANRRGSRSCIARRARPGNGQPMVERSATRKGRPSPGSGFLADPPGQPPRIEPPPSGSRRGSARNVRRTESSGAAGGNVRASRRAGTVVSDSSFLPSRAAARTTWSYTTAHPLRARCASPRTSLSRSGTGPSRLPSCVVPASRCPAKVSASPHLVARRATTGRPEKGQGLNACAKPERWPRVWPAGRPAPAKPH